MSSGNTGATARSRPRSRPRTFTLEEARRALPLVQRIVRDIVEQHRTIRRLEKERRLLDQFGTPDQIRQTDEKGHAAGARLAELIDEINQIGCELKDLEKGLVDFPSLFEERRIELCWMLGEESVEWWHEATAGFAGRKRISNDGFLNQLH